MDGGDHSYATAAPELGEQAYPQVNSIQNEKEQVHEEGFPSNPTRLRFNNRDWPGDQALVAKDISKLHVEV